MSKSFWDRVKEGGTYEFKKILEAKRDDKGERKFVCEMRGSDSSHNNWGPAFPSWIQKGS